MERYPFMRTTCINFKTHYFPIFAFATCFLKSTLHVMVMVIKSTVAVLLARSANLVLSWFTDNWMKGNEGKCHVLLSPDETMQVIMNERLIMNAFFHHSAAIVLS